MTVDELIGVLLNHPPDAHVRMVVLDREGVFVDPHTGSIDAVTRSDDTEPVVWLGGSATSDVPPNVIDANCHCGMLHPIGTDDLVCPLRERR